MVVGAVVVVQRVLVRAHPCHHVVVVLPPVAVHVLAPPLRSTVTNGRGCRFEQLAATTTDWRLKGASSLSAP
eukprot:4606135-Pyramimonas_sp.AAC.1